MLEISVAEFPRIVCLLPLFDSTSKAVLFSHYHMFLAPIISLFAIVFISSQFIDLPRSSWILTLLVATFVPS